MRLPFFYGWVVVAVTFVTMAIGVNARTAFSLFFPPIISEFGWERGLTAGAFSFGFIVSAVLSPLLKQRVDRLRPIVDIPVATAGGPSFPSGHTLAATVWVGVVLLVLLPVVPSRRRRLAVAAGVAVVVVVGLTRIALGVHFVSDVLAGWLVGVGWLLVTATAFRAWRRRDGLAVPSAVDGLAPEVAGDLDHAPERPPVHPWTTVAQLLVTAVLLLGALVGIGLLIVHVGTGTAFERAALRVP